MKSYKLSKETISHLKIQFYLPDFFHFPHFFAKNLIRTRANRFDKARFAEITKTGFPEVSFDNFALQEFDSNGVYANPNHGISDISVQFGNNGYQTSYSLKRSSRRSDPLH